MPFQAFEVKTKAAHFTQEVQDQLYPVESQL